VALIRLAEAAAGAVTVVTLGALTNLAIALNLEPRLPEMLKRVVVMGGAFHVGGNVTPTAEFNIWEDPEAAAQIFAAPFNELVAVGLDVTNRVRLNATVIEALDEQSELTPAAKLVHDLGHSPMWRGEGSKLALHDPIAVAAAADSSLFAFEFADVHVATEGDEAGRTTVAGAGPVRVATQIDDERFFQLFHDRLGLPSA
jgi:inosine-uridine nucleoside N-ribohydrolase